MTEKQAKIIETIENLIDLMEEQYGNLEGVEIKLSHPILKEEGRRQNFAKIDEVIIYYLRKEKLPLLFDE